MPEYVALLRGVNVGGRSKVAMADLRAVTAGLGHEQVRTYVNSGNVLFRTPRRDRDAVAAELRAALQEALGREVPVVVRSRDHLADVVAFDPFPDADPRQLHVSFMSAAPDEAAVTAMLAVFDGHPERAVVRGSEAYVDFVNGAGRTKVDLKALERRGGVEATARSWRTVTTLLRMLDEQARG